LAFSHATVIRLSHFQRLGADSTADCEHALPGRSAIFQITRIAARLKKPPDMTGHHRLAACHRFFDKRTGDKSRNSFLS
jgi:hypothetical protein